MKSFQYGILFPFLFSVFPLLAQYDEPISQSSSIEIEEDRYYLITMKDGRIIYAKILETVFLEYQLINAQGEKLTVLVADIVKIERKGKRKFGSAGLGFGIPYGGLGLNQDIRIFEHFHISGGIGTILGVFPLYSVGGKLIFRSEYDMWRPRFSAYYGTNRLLYSNQPTQQIRTVYTGISLAFGQQWMLGDRRMWGLDLDLLYLLPNDEYKQLYQQINPGAPSGWIIDLKLSFGVRYHF